MADIDRPSPTIGGYVPIPDSDLEKNINSTPEDPIQLESTNSENPTTEEQPTQQPPAQRPAAIPHDDGFNFLFYFFCISFCIFFFFTF